MLAELAAEVLAGRVSSAELVREALDRIDRRDGDLNAVVTRCDERALAEARSLDDRLRAGRGGRAGVLPLAGLPLLVKDIEDVAGLPTTHGSLLFADAQPAGADSATVGKLRAAGAIVIGKSNTSEFAFEGYTDNRLFGTTRNPWNHAWSAGGSSGGSAAALAAGLVPLATSSDGGGSSRGPAAVCGLLGLKPTNGLIGRRPAPVWLDLSTDGLMATSADDLALLLGLLAGPVPGDPDAAPAARRQLDGAEPRRIVAASRIQAGPPLGAELETLFRSALAALEVLLGLEADPVDPGSIYPGTHHPDDDSLILIEAETVAWLGRGVVTRERERFDPHFAVYLDHALGLTLDDYLGARRRRFDHARALDEVLGEAGILVTPVSNMPGLLADGTVPGIGPGLENALANTNPQNVTGHPAISLPAGLQASGIPFGLQVTAPRYRDDLLLEIARRWEGERPWPTTAPGCTPFGPA